MKTHILLIILIFISTSLFAQIDSSDQAVMETPDGRIAEPIDTVFDEVPDEGIINETPEEGFADEIPEEQLQDSDKSDTVHIRFGNHTVEITTDNDKTHIDVEKIEDFESQWKSGDTNWERDWNQKDRVETIHHRKNKKFDGHWAGIDFGGNQLWDTKYSIYPEGTPNFITTSPEKSFEVNLNLLEYSFGFSSYIGLVTGLGLNFNDYKFKNRLTLTKDDAGIIQPVELPEGDFRLSKLSTTFITAPLLLEVQIPGQWDHNRMFITAGVIGGVKIHEHTKTKVGDEKKRDNGDHNIAPLRWGYTARIGFDNMGVFATYYNTKLFEKGLGPETTPVTIGLTFLF